MDRSDAVEIIAGIVIAVGSLAYLKKKMQLKALTREYRLLHDWARTAQKIIDEAVERDPLLPISISDDVDTLIAFHEIVRRENLS